MRERDQRRTTSTEDVKTGEVNEKRTWKRVKRFRLISCFSFEAAKIPLLRRQIPDARRLLALPVSTRQPKPNNGNNNSCKSLPIIPSLGVRLYDTARLTANWIYDSRNVFFEDEVPQLTNC